MSLGQIDNPCLLPCSTTFVETKFGYEKSLANDGETETTNILGLTFIPLVETTTTEYEGFKLATFFSSAGGLLGLWLGYSVLSVLQYTITECLPR